MDFDQILTEIGEFGRYQKTNYLLICLPVMFAAANSLSYVFTAGTPAYRCFIPTCDNPNNPQLDEPWLTISSPGTFNKRGQFIPKSCYRFGNNASFTNESSADLCPEEMFDSSIQEKCNQFIFDPDERTIVQEWNLTCEQNAWRLAFVGTMHFAGLVVGTAVSGYFADRFGRKFVFIINIIFMAITGIIQGLSWNYNSFLVFAFLNAVGTSGVYPLAFIIGVEMVGPRKREMSSMVLNYFYAVGEAMVGLLAWLLHDWQLLQYALSVPPLFFIAYYWLVPESVRWLLARNEKQKACIIIQRAAQINKKELSTALISNFSEDSQSNDKTSQGKSGSNKSIIWMSTKEIFKSKTLLVRYIFTIYIWVINSVVYYGLSLNSTSLSGNKYLNFALVCLVEIPGYSLAWVSLRKFGRRFSLSGSMFLCALTCVGCAYATNVVAKSPDARSHWIIISLFLVGKLGITSSFAVIYAYTAEMMPTVIRSGGVGVCSTFARFGAMLAPFVPLLGTYYDALPLLLFGIASFSAGLLGLLLPETFRRKLPDTVEDAKRLGNAKMVDQDDLFNGDMDQKNEAKEAD